MSRVRYVLLAEDLSHARFVREFLKKIKGDFVEEHPSRISPSGIGSGEQFVRVNFPMEVNVFRSRNYQPKLGLVVVTDADRMEVDQRVSQLNNSLSQQQLHPIQKDEPVLLVIPKWCIETWVFFLKAGAADESKECQKYKNQVEQRDYRIAARRFAEAFRSPPDDWLPSLKTAAAEAAAWLNKLS